MKDVTVAYHRDRGEELNPARVFNDIGEVIAYFDWNEYFYVFEDGEWYVYTTIDDRKLVKDVLKDLGV